MILCRWYCCVKWRGKEDAAVESSSVPWCWLQVACYCRHRGYGDKTEQTLGQLFGATKAVKVTTNEKALEDQLSVARSEIVSLRDMASREAVRAKEAQATASIEIESLQKVISKEAAQAREAKEAEAAAWNEMDCLRESFSREAAQAQEAKRSRSCGAE